MQVISWLPADTCAAIITEIAETTSTTSIFHVRHPRPILWTDIMDHFSSIMKLPIVPYLDWLSKLLAVLDSTDTKLSKYVAPATRLLPIWQSAARYSTPPHEGLITESMGIGVLLDIEDSAQRCSLLRDPSLRHIEVDDVRKWIAYWRSVDALPAI